MRCRSITARSLALHSGMAVLGGLAYMGIELLWRGRTHWTMGVLGGVCFVLIGLLDEVQEHPPLPLQMLQGRGDRDRAGAARGAGGQPLARLGRVGLLGHALQPLGAGMPAVFRRRGSG